MTICPPEVDTDLTWDLEELFDKSLPCDYEGFSCHRGGPARWRAWLVPCPRCGRNSGPRAICTDCKDYIVRTNDAAKCGHCDEVVHPFRRVLRALDAL